MKPWYESKTLWVNIIALVGVVIGTMTQWPELAQYGPQFTTALAIVNLLLRFVTFEAISNVNTTK
jgi:hypothetical protein